MMMNVQENTKREEEGMGGVAKKREREKKKVKYEEVFMQRVHGDDCINYVDIIIRFFLPDTV